jgi:hypothetical protein
MSEPCTLRREQLVSRPLPEVFAFAYRQQVIAKLFD